MSKKKKIKLINSDGNMNPESNFEYLEFTFKGINEDKEEEKKDDITEENKVEEIVEVTDEKDDNTNTDINKDNTNKEIYTYDGSNKLKVKRRLYFSFRTRIIIYSILFILFMILGIFCFYKVYINSLPNTVQYNEISSIGYDACNFSNQCFNNEIYSSFVANNTNNININYKYNVKFSEKIDYNIGYYVEADFNIKDSYNEEILLFNRTDKLIDKVNLNDSSKNININENINLDFNSYYKELVDYMNSTKINAIGYLDVKLYTVDDKDTINVSTLKLTINNGYVTTKIKNVNNINKNVVVSKNNWNDKNTSYTIICIICLIIVLFSFIRLSHLIVKTFTSKNKYKKTLDRLLSVYDSDIVIARDGYNSLDNKKVIRVESFDELLDAKNILQRPIIYVRVNDVKSHFIVEDLDSIYLFVLKDLNS